MLTPRRTVSVVLLACSCMLLAISAARAYLLDFTHDECLSYAALTWDKSWLNTANYHLLNSWLMDLCSKLFGTSELSLRLPNLVAHAIYLLASLRLSLRLQNHGVSAFALLNLNTFVLNYFSQARGYGIGMGLMLLSIDQLLECHTRKISCASFGAPLLVSLLAGGLSVLANYTFLNYFVPAVIVASYLLATDSSAKYLILRRTPPAITTALLGACFASAVALQLLKLKAMGQLYFGGEIGFITDSVGSIIACTIDLNCFFSVNPALIASVFLIAVCLSIAWLKIRSSGSPLPAFAILFFILLVSALLPVFQHTAFDALYPYKRTALMYWPLFCVVFVFGADTIRRGNRPSRIVTELTIGSANAVALFLFCKNLAFVDNYTNRHDLATKAALEAVERDKMTHYPARPISIGASWILEPSLNFYRVTHPYPWLSQVTRENPMEGGYDYLYLVKSDLKTALPFKTTLLGVYDNIITPDDTTALLRVEQ